MLSISQQQADPSLEEAEQSNPIHLCVFEADFRWDFTEITFLQIRKLEVSFILFCFVLDMESHSVAQAGLKLLCSCLSLPSSWTTGVHHHTWLNMFRFGVICKHKECLSNGLLKTTAVSEMGPQDPFLLSQGLDPFSVIQDPIRIQLSC
jgi:hypothetical protein